MKIIVMSDSHGSFAALQKVVKRQQDADLFVFLGDGERDLNLLFTGLPSLEEKFLVINGNCDAGLLLPQARSVWEYSLPYGHKLFATHGHRFDVYFSADPLLHEAAQCHADIVLYGHTHCRDMRYEDGVYILNPGSLGAPRDGKPASYGVISLSEKGILVNIAEV